MGIRMQMILQMRFLLCLRRSEDPFYLKKSPFSLVNKCKSLIFVS